MKGIKEKVVERGGLNLKSQIEIKRERKKGEIAGCVKRRSGAVTSKAKQ